MPTFTRSTARLVAIRITHDSFVPFIAFIPFDPFIVFVPPIPFIASEPPASAVPLTRRRAARSPGR
ncbi:hypothetical protein GCM10019017_44700 [Streptomyces showdoensis]